MILSILGIWACLILLIVWLGARAAETRGRNHD